MRLNVLRHGQKARSFRKAIVAFAGHPSGLDTIIRDDYFAPDSLNEMRLIEQIAYEDWLLSGKCIKTIFFSTDQSRNVVLNQ